MIYTNIRTKDVKQFKTKGAVNMEICPNCKATGKTLYNDDWIKCELCNGDRVVFKVQAYLPASFMTKFKEKHGN